MTLDEYVKTMDLIYTVNQGIDPATLAECERAASYSKPEEKPLKTQETSIYEDSHFESTIAHEEEDHCMIY
jgi:hypothetical protein